MKMLIKDWQHKNYPDNYIDMLLLQLRGLSLLWSKGVLL